MHGQQNDKYIEMHGQQNDKYTEIHGQQNVKIYIILVCFSTIYDVRTTTRSPNEAFVRNHHRR
jgi:hypothetical protein